VALVEFLAMAEYFKGFSRFDHTLPTRPEPTWQNMAKSCLIATTQPVKIEENFLCPMDGQWLKKTQKT